MKLQSMTISSIVTGLFLLLQGCAAKKEVTEQATSVVPRVSLEQFAAMAKANRIFCSGDRCPEGVGRVMTYHQSNVTMCTGSLISANQVLTAAHCIPADFKDDETLCGKNFYFQLPAIGGLPSESIACKRVDYLGNAEHGRDYAVITLKSSSEHTPLRISQRGLKNMQDAFVWTADLSDNQTSVVNLKRCKSVFESFLYRNIKTSNGPHLLLGDCFIVTGNSGAPILNSRGGMVGLITSSFSQDYLSELSRIHNFIEQPGSFAIAANASCFSIPGVIEANGQNCEDIRREEYASVDLMTHQLDRNRMALEMEDALSIWKNDYKRFFKWKRQEIRVENPYRIPFYPVPECLVSAQYWKPELIQYLGYTPKEYKEIVEVSLWSANLGLDRYGKFNFKITTLASHFVGEFAIPVKNIHPNKNKIQITGTPVLVNEEERILFTSGGATLANPIFNQEISFCESPFSS